jgi:hypothetical protein
VAYDPCDDFWGAEERLARLKSKSKAKKNLFKCHQGHFSELEGRATPKQGDGGQDWEHSRAAKSHLPLERPFKWPSKRALKSLKL